MRRIQFRKGFQRRFIKKVLDEINCPSLRELINRGISVNYSTLKNYYCEERLLPEEFFLSLCEIAKFNTNNFNFKILDKNWGQVIGGKKSKRN